MTETLPYPENGRPVLENFMRSLELLADGATSPAAVLTCLRAYSDATVTPPADPAAERLARLWHVHLCGGSERTRRVSPR